MICVEELEGTFAEGRGFYRESGDLVWEGPGRHERCLPYQGEVKMSIPGSVHVCIHVGFFVSDPASEIAEVVATKGTRCFNWLLGPKIAEITTRFYPVGRWLHDGAQGFTCEFTVQDKNLTGLVEMQQELRRVLETLLEHHEGLRVHYEFELRYAAPVAG